MLFLKYSPWSPPGSPGFPGCPAARRCGLKGIFYYMIIIPPVKPFRSTGFETGLKPSRNQQMRHCRGGPVCAPSIQEEHLGPPLQKINYLYDRSLVKQSRLQPRRMGSAPIFGCIPLDIIRSYLYYIRLNKVKFKANPTVTTEKAYPRPCRWQSEVRHKAENRGTAAPCPQAPPEGCCYADPEYSWDVLGSAFTDLQGRSFLLRKRCLIK